MPDTRSAPVTVPRVRATKVREGHETLVLVPAYYAPAPASWTPGAST